MKKKKVLYDRGATLVNGFDYYVCVCREFFQCSEVIWFGVFSPLGGGYVVLQTQLVRCDDGFEIVAAHRGILLAFRLEFKTASIIKWAYTGPIGCYDLIVLKMTF